jgi:hypothetical protein
MQGNQLASEPYPNHNLTMSQQRQRDAAASLGRLQRNCSACAHPKREEIEAAFIGWRSPGRLPTGTGWRTGPASTVTLTPWDSFRSVSGTCGRRWSESSKDRVKYR